MCTSFHSYRACNGTRLHHLLKNSTLVMLLTEEIYTQLLSSSNVSEDWSRRCLSYLLFTVSLFTCLILALKLRLPFTGCNGHKTL
uniref:Uncharacterized protein n=4 Tax=Aegilops tauschii subsp. strangulata TaxID=200361 RepID=A0A453A6W3_AEGTS